MSADIDIGWLHQSLLGQELDEAECRALAAQMGVQQLDDGAVLVREGDADNRLFLLVEGRLEVVGRPHGSEEVVHVMSPAEFAGTRAFVDRSPRQATLRARGKAKVYTLDPEDFESLVDANPRLTYKVMRAMFRITHINLMRMNKEAQQLINYVHKTHGRY